MCKQNTRWDIEDGLDITVERPRFIKLDYRSSLPSRRTESPAAKALILEAAHRRQRHYKSDPAVRPQVPLDTPGKEITRQILMSGDLTADP
jgi:hypothetical protein